MAGFRTQVDLRINYGAVDRMLRQPDGLTGRYIQRLGREVAERARQNAPVKTGALRRSIGMTVANTARGMEVKVAANIEYAMAIHQGVKGGDTIEPKRASVLRFPDKAGMIVYAPRVTRGTIAPNPFLWNALVAVVN